MTKILVVDDDPQIAEVIEQYFDGPEYQVCSMVEGERVPQTVSKIKPDLILLDLKLPDVYGMDILRDLKKQHVQAPIVIITGTISAGVAMEAMKEGAYEYLPKPFSLEELGKLVNRLSAKDAVSEDLSSVQKEPYQLHQSGELVGRSAEILKIGKIIGQAASSEVPILISGESGTGKALVAQIIHRNSRRKDKPFFAVNCAHPSPQMLEEELFGQAKPGQEHTGKLELCSGGTILLEDIESMSLSTQNKLLKGLKKGEISPPRGSIIGADVRIIAASSEDLAKSVNQGKFMQELFYNLRVITISVPPLRERKSDIPLLAEHFLNEYGQQIQKTSSDLSPDAMRLLMSYSWPGNVRELENNIYSGVVMCKGGQILPEHLPIFYEGGLKAQLDFQKGKHDYSRLLMQSLDPIKHELFGDLKGKAHHYLIGSLERALICMSLDYCGGNQVKAAALLGISRNTLRERMLKFGVCQKEKSRHSTLPEP